MPTHSISCPSSGGGGTAKSSGLNVSPSRPKLTLTHLLNDAITGLLGAFCVSSLPVVPYARESLLLVQVLRGRPLSQGEHGRGLNYSSTNSNAGVGSHINLRNLVLMLGHIMDHAF